MDFDEYVGLPYKEGGETPEGFNCWGLLRYVLRYNFGVIIPNVPIHDATASVQWFVNGVRAGEVIELPGPVHGAGVLLRGGDAPHVGVYLDIDGGGVLHALEDLGVVFSPMDSLRVLGYSRLKYYRYDSTTDSIQEPVPRPPGR